MDTENLQSLRGAGIALAGSGLLAAALMHYHPHGDDTAALIRSSHGALLLLIMIQPAVLALVARALGWNLLTALALTFFAFGTLGAVLAGTINGFVLPAMWAYPEGEIASGVTDLAWQMNQASATLGAIAAGFGIALYGVALWRSGWRIIGGTGVFAGVVPAALLLTGVTDMHFTGAILTYVTYLLWQVALGIALFRQESVSSPSNP